MKSFAALALFATLAASVNALTVDTPASLVQCLPVRITWREGVAPFFPSVIPGGQPSATPLKTFPQTNDEALTWVVDLQAGTSVNLAVRDSTGEQVFSSALTIQSSDDSSCLNGGSSSSGTGTATGTATTPAGTTTATTGGSTTAAGTTTPAQTTGATTRATTSGTTAGTGTTTGTGAQQSDNAAVRSSMSAFGLAGVMGLIGAALF